jgi:ABC-type nitrate/sulfonate/bicarbonate transport system ATPase subunit
MSVTGTLQIKKLNKSFKVDNKEMKVLENIDLNVAAGEFVSIVGTSGCGKTTLLRLIVGLEGQYAGDIILDGKRLNGPSVDRGIVFQDHRLLPWLTVEQNIGFGLHKRKKADRKSIVQQHIRLVGLKGFEHEFPYKLSGGMAQRAAIARGLVNRPDILTLDEPLGALDALTRMYMQVELEKIWKQEGISMIMVTHDIEEAIFLSDWVVIMSPRPGRIKRIMPISLARPRDRDSFEFIHIKNEILKEFHLDAEKYFTYSI